MQIKSLCRSKMIPPPSLSAAVEVDRRVSCILVNFGLEIKMRHGLDTHLNRQRDLTGNLKRMSSMISSGMSGRFGFGDDDDALLFLFLFFLFWSPILLFRASMIIFLERGMFSDKSPFGH